MVFIILFIVFCIENDDVGYCSGLVQFKVEDFSFGQVLICVNWFLVNYKDVLVGIGKGKILCCFLLVGGIDVVGIVVVSIDLEWCEGDVVLVIGCGFSEICDGGYSQYVWLELCVVIVQLVGLSLCEVMVLGIVGFIVVLVLLCMQDNWQSLEFGLLVVIGVSGGVGVLVLLIFSCVGYMVYVISGKFDQIGFLYVIGVIEVLLCEVLVDIGLL